jgi:PIN domain nuclease of toxin-antitoxin system
MTILLDTHLLLWAARGDAALPSSVAELINEPTNELVFSVANIWEVAIKSSLGRADFEVNPHILRSRLLENGYVELPITGEHVLAVANLPNLHKDSFDRVLVAQATVDGLTLLTVDPLVASYPGPIVKA